MDATPTPWPPRPDDLADWPLAWRERWGRKANDLEADGVPYPESERRAWAETLAERADPDWRPPAEPEAVETPKAEAPRKTRQDRLNLGPPQGRRR
jgi:hypothetical protein